MNNKKNYWFPAKRYGWGWGIPNCWQGWVVYLTYFSLLTAGILFRLPSSHEAAFIGMTIVSTLLLVVICWIKGEPPSWHWGKE